MGVNYSWPPRQFLNELFNIMSELNVMSLFKLLTAGVVLSLVAAVDAPPPGRAALRARGCELGPVLSYHVRHAVLRLRQDGRSVSKEQGRGKHHPGSGSSWLCSGFSSERPRCAFSMYEVGEDEPRRRERGF